MPLTLGLLVLAATVGCGSVTPGLTARGESWISPDAAQTSELLFESDYAFQSLEMFSLPDLKLKGVITGVPGASGMCSDSNGDIYVLNEVTISEATEYSHSGKKLGTVDDYEATPSSCAVNPVNGDFVIANVKGRASETGNISLYAKAKSGYPRYLSCKAISSYYFVDYAPGGELFTDGVGSDNHVHVCRGRDVARNSLTEVKVVGVTINTPGMVQWYQPGKYLAVGDQHCTGSGASCVYHIAISGNSGRVTGSTKPLNADGSPICDLVQGVISPGGGMLLFGGNDPSGCASQAPSVNEWPYPAGGVPSKHYDNIHFINKPVGAAISVKP